MTKWENRRKNGDMNNSEFDDDISYNRTLEYIASLRVDNTIGNEFVDAIKQGYDSKNLEKLKIQEFHWNKSLDPLNSRMKSKMLPNLKSTVVALFDHMWGD